MDTVKEIRRRKAWSQKDLAEESGVGQDTISGIESGRHEPRPSTLRKLADALDVEVADFFREPAVPLAEAPRETGPVPNSIEELLERRHTRTRHLADENLAATLAQRPLEDVLDIVREASDELKAIGPDVARLRQQTANHAAMRLFSEVERQAWIVRLALSARRPELEAEVDETVRKLEESREIAGVR